MTKDQLQAIELGRTTLKRLTEELNQVQANLCTTHTKLDELYLECDHKYADGTTALTSSRICNTCKAFLINQGYS